MVWRGSVISLVVALALVGLLAGPAGAGAVLHIGDPPNSGTYLFNGELLPISDLGVLENGNGQPELVDPALLLILGVPNDASFALPAITLSTGTADVGGTSNYFSGTWNTTTGYAGSFDAGDSGGVYEFIGLDPSGNASNSFVNWSAADLAVNGIVADFFGIYVYVLTGTGLSGGETIDVTFASALPGGVFAVAYGQDSSGNAFTTPFTEAGLTVPEPATMLLLGTGLIGLAGIGRKRFRK